MHTPASAPGFKTKKKIYMDFSAIRDLMPGQTLSLSIENTPTIKVLRLPGSYLMMSAGWAVRLDIEDFEKRAGPWP